MTAFSSPCCSKNYPQMFAYSSAGGCLRKKDWSLEGAARGIAGQGAPMLGRMNIKFHTHCAAAVIADKGTLREIARWSCKLK